LLAVPYLQGYRGASGASGITLYDVHRAAPGVNLYVSGHGPEAILMDMNGAVLHRWRHGLRRTWPDLDETPQLRKLEYWRRAHLLDNGDLLAIFEGLGLIRLDRDSQLLWQHRGGIHHDLEVTADGLIYVLDREGKVLPRIHPEKGVLEDFVTILDADGQTLRRISLLRAFENSLYAPLLHRMRPTGDIFHTNTLEVLDGTGADRLPAFQAGNLLISVLELDTIAVVDPVREAVVWALSGVSRKQHQPTVVAGGNLLLFDNLGAGGRRSRVLELDPSTQEVRWRYGGTEAVDFFSKTLGSCQRLPNGNTLITESENGRAFEITRQGEIVWEMINPHRTGEGDALIAALFEVVRLPLDHPFLSSLDGSSEPALN
jgi:hypothetical protein